MFITTFYYDFKLEALKDTNSAALIGNNIQTAIGLPQTERLITYTPNNDTLIYMPVSQEERTRESTVIKKTSSSTDAYEFSESIGTEIKFKAGNRFGVESSLEIGFSASKLFSTTIGNEISNEIANEHSTSVSIDCPPHTMAVLVTDRYDGYSTIQYQYPIAVTYKTQMVGVYANSNGLFGLIDSAVTVCNFSKSENPGGDNNAVDSLVNRWNNKNIPGFENTYKGSNDNMISAINWNIEPARNRRSVPHILDRLNNRRPFNDAGGSLRIETDGVRSTANMYPMYPLEHIVLLPFNPELTINQGDKLYLDDIGLEGRDKDNVKYYGFDAKFGDWHLFDSDGNDITEIGNSIATLETDDMSSLVYLKPGDTVGSVYLKYYIDENRYGYCDGIITNITNFAKNDDLTSTAVVKVNVTPLTIPVTDVSISPKSLNLYLGQNSQLNAQVKPENASNKEVSFFSSDPSIASVGKSSGIVTANKAGQATITIRTTDGEFDDTCAVTVIDGELPKLNVQNVWATCNTKTGMGGNDDVKNVSVPIKIVNNPGISTMRIFILFDEDYLELDQVDDGRILGNSEHGDNHRSPYALFWVNSDLTENIMEDGTIATLNFRVKDDTPVGKYDIEIIYDYDGFDVINVDMMPVYFKTENGSINVIDFVYGDVTEPGVGSVTPLASSVLSRYLALWEGYDVINEKAADVDIDTRVTPRDLSIIRRHLAGWEGYATLPMPYEPLQVLQSSSIIRVSATPTINVSSAIGSVGDIIDVPISLINNE